MDKEIPISELREGDYLHVTVMGGDDYIQVKSVNVEGDRTHWSGHFISAPGEIDRTESSKTMVRVGNPWG